MSRKLTPYILYRIFNCMKLHFSLEGYSIEKYGLGNRQFRGKNFDKDRFWVVWNRTIGDYQSVEHAMAIFAGNLSKDPTILPIDINPELGYYLWRWNNNKRAFIDDFLEMRKSLFASISKGDIIGHIMSGKTPIEMIAFLSRIMPLEDLIEASIDDKYTWNLVKTRIHKLKPFCTFRTPEERNNLYNRVKTILTED